MHRLLVSAAHKSSGKTTVTLGLLAALRRFDISRGFRFSTYSVWWVRHYIGRYIDDNSRSARQRRDSPCFPSSGLDCLA